VDGDAVGDATVKGGVGLMSGGGQLMRRLVRAVQSGKLPRAGAPVGGGMGHDDGEGDHDVRNVQVNDPALDHITTFDPSVVVTRPFEFSTQSETSAVKDGDHVVVGYNSSATATVQFFPGFGLAFTKLMFSAFSVSHDGGRLGQRGKVGPDAATCARDPLAIDRRDASARVSAPPPRGQHDHRNKARIAARPSRGDDRGGRWIGQGVAGDRSDPTALDRAITSTSPGRASARLEHAPVRPQHGWRRTFSTRTPVRPVVEPELRLHSVLNPVVDLSTGRLITFLHFSGMDADNVRVLVSTTAGWRSALAFNVPGPFYPFPFPSVSPGLLNECAGGCIRNALVAGMDQGGGRFGLPRFRQATRLITQPHAAAARGAFTFVVNRSTSASFGDPNGGSDIIAVFSRDGGLTWTSTRVVASSAADPQHVHPALSLSDDAKKLTVSYYVQQADRRLRTDVATLKVDGGRLRRDDVGGLSSTAFDLTPSNIVRTPTTTTNYDRAVVSCYDIGEYQTLARSRSHDEDDDSVIAAWGDNRRTWL
jgi:hypothetical protein